MAYLGKEPPRQPSQNQYIEKFSGDGSTTQFLLSKKPTNVYAIAVYISGVYQLLTTDYYLSGYYLNFSSAPVNGTDNIVVHHIAVQETTIVPADGSVTMEKLDPTVQNKLSELLGVRDYGDSDGIGNITLNVPSSYATIQAAFDYLANKRIISGTTVKINVAYNTYNLTAGIYMNHPDGSQIQLIGNGSILDFGTTTVDALVVSSGNKIGLIDNFVIRKDTKATVGKWNSSDGADDIDNTTGILATDGSSINCTNITVQNFYYGIAAREGSYISAPLAIVSGGGDVGIWAFTGSMVYCPGATSSNCKDVSVTSTGTNALGFGIQAEYGSTVNCTMSGTTKTHATGNYIAGIAALSGSTVRAYDCISYSNTGHGLYAKGGGTIVAHRADLYSNTGYGWITEDLSVIQGSSITFSVANTAGDSIGNRVATQSTGDLRVDTTSNGAKTYFNSGRGSNFAISDSGATSTGYWLAQGASTSNSSQVTLTAHGSTNQSGAFYSSGTGSLFFNSGNGCALEVADNGATSTGYTKFGAATSGLSNQVTLDFTHTTTTDVGARYRTKGAGAHYFSTSAGGALQFSVEHVASTVNRVFVKGSTGTNPVEVGVNGSGGSDLDLKLTTVGNGVIRFGTYSSSSDVTCNGYILIKDAGGTSRKLMTTA